MPTTFTPAVSGNLATAASLNQFIAPINAIELALVALQAAPPAHTHVIADVTNLQTTLDGKAPSSHTHAIAEVTNLQTTLDGKAAVSSLATKSDVGHTHPQTDVTGLTTALAGKAASVHTHAIADVTNLQTSLDAKLTGPLSASDILTALAGVAINLGTSSGTGNALAGASVVDAATTFTAGRLYRIRSNAGNTGATTCAINGGTGVDIRKSPSSAALASGDIASGVELLLYYDGTYLQALVGLTVSASDATKMPLAGGTMTGALTMGSGSKIVFSASGTINTAQYEIIRTAGASFFLSAPSGADIGMGIGYAGTLTITASAVTYALPVLMSGNQTEPSSSSSGHWVNTTSGLHMQGGAGVVATTGRLVSRANSTAYSLCPCPTGDVMRCLLQDSSSKRAVALVDASGTVTFESGSHADYVAGSSPASGEVGVYINSGFLTIKPGSAGTRSIAAFPQRARA